MDIKHEQDINNDLLEDQEKMFFLPSAEDLEAQLEWERDRSRRFKVLRNIVLILIAAVVAVALLAILLMSVLQIYGSSMEPQLKEGDVVLSRKAKDLASGDVIAFYYDDNVLVKRLIGNPGDWIDIDRDGNVYVNGELLEEPYISEKTLGECDIELPYQVPADEVFVMGDNRSASIDSRNAAVGCIDEEQVMGKLVFKIWPIREIGFVR